MANDSLKIILFSITSCLFIIQPINLFYYYLTVSHARQKLCKLITTTIYEEESIPPTPKRSPKIIPSIHIEPFWSSVKPSSPKHKTDPFKLKPLPVTSALSTPQKPQRKPKDGKTRRKSSEWDEG